MRLQISIDAKRYDGTLPIEGDLLISVQRHPVNAHYPVKTAWARKHEDLIVFPKTERELLTHAVLRLAAWLTSSDDGMTVYSDDGQRVAENLMG